MKNNKMEESIKFTKWILNNTVPCNPKKGDRARFINQTSIYESLKYEQLYSIFKTRNNK